MKNLANNFFALAALMTGLVGKLMNESYTFRASADLREAVEAHAAALGITLSEDMRLALKEYYHLMAVLAMVIFVYLLDTFVDLATAILD